MEYLAIDIGASSGKLLKGWLEDGILRTEVVHRFPNSLIKAAEHACWDIAYLEDEVIKLWKATGTTVIFITHNIEEAADLAEKPPIGKRIKGMFNSKYDKNGLLILREEDFIH